MDTVVMSVLRRQRSSSSASRTRLQSRQLSANPGDAGPDQDWSLTTLKATLKEKLIKVGAKVVSHGRYVAFQMAEVAISRTLFADILRLVAELRPSPATLAT